MCCLNGSRKLLMQKNIDNVQGRGCLPFLPPFLVIIGFCFRLVEKYAAKIGSFLNISKIFINNVQIFINFLENRNNVAIFAPK